MFSLIGYVLITFEHSLLTTFSYCVIAYFLYLYTLWINLSQKMLSRYKEVVILRIPKKNIRFLMFFSNMVM
jgi:hypothetical protein